MSSGWSSEPDFPPEAYVRLEDLMVSDPDAIRLLIYLLTGADVDPAAAGAALVAAGTQEIEQGAGLIALASLRASPTA